MWAQDSVYLFRCFWFKQQKSKLSWFNKKGDLLLTHVTRKYMSESDFTYSIIQRFLMSSQI